MKVLFTFGGLPHYSNYILSRLNNIEGLEIVVVVPQNESETIGDGVMQTKEGVNFKVVQLPEYKTFYGKYFFKQFKRTLKAEQPDIIVTIWPYILYFVINLSLKSYIKKHGIKLILKEIPFNVPKFKHTFTYYKSNWALTLNEDLKQSEKVNVKFYIKYFVLKYIRKYYYTRLVDATINYIDAAKEIISSYGLDKEKIFITTNSLDTDLLFQAAENIKNQPLILPENKYRIIHIGRLVKWKKTHQIIHAVAKIKNIIPDIELIIIGKGKEEISLKALVKELNLEENIIFIGGVYDNETLGRYLHASSVYVLAGMGGLSINQAMAFGKPVVCSIADGTEKRLVKDGYNGFYFKSDDIDDLAEKIIRILNSEELRIRMGKNSLQIIKEDVNVHRVIKGHVDAFNYVMKTNVLQY